MVGYLLSSLCLSCYAHGTQAVSSCSLACEKEREREKGDDLHTPVCPPHPFLLSLYLSLSPLYLFHVHLHPLHLSSCIVQLTQRATRRPHAAHVHHATISHTRTYHATPRRTTQNYAEPPKTTQHPSCLSSGTTQPSRSHHAATTQPPRSHHAAATQPSRSIYHAHLYSTSPSAL